MHNFWVAGLLLTLGQSLEQEKQGSNFTHEANRKHLITRQNCVNITRGVRDLSSHRHAEDAISTDWIVAELQKETPSQMAV